MSFSSDLDVIFKDLRGLPGGSATVLTCGRESHVCEPGEPGADLNPVFEGEDTERSASVIIRPADWAHVPKEGELVTYGAKKWRVVGTDQAVDGLTVTLTLGSVRR